MKSVDDILINTCREWASVSSRRENELKWHGSVTLSLNRNSFLPLCLLVNVHSQMLSELLIKMFVALCLSPAHRTTNTSTHQGINCTCERPILDRELSTASAFSLRSVIMVHCWFHFTVSVRVSSFVKLSSGFGRCWTLSGAFTFTLGNYIYLLCAGLGVSLKIQSSDLKEESECERFSWLKRERDGNNDSFTFSANIRNAFEKWRENVRLKEEKKREASRAGWVSYNEVLRQLSWN